MVMGIMGKTQGVKMEARPKPKATSRNAPRPCGVGAGRSPRAAARPVWPRRNPAGMAGARHGRAGSTVKPPRAVRLARRDALLVVAGLEADFRG